ncbi:MAG: hypothetical protein HY814_09470 [Candidatus Riflebacteria bacterium]|nr:hypothetical protein [Candidatus Riflebacteria bacterium]
MPSAASSTPKPAPSSWPKPLLSLLLAATLLMSPTLVGSAPTTDMALIVAMSTVNDVRESLDEKLGLLSQACEQYRELKAGSREREALQRGMELHFQNAKDIQELALSFLGSSSQRFPEYGRYWDNYRQRLLETWQKVRVLHDALQRAPEVAEAAPPAPVAAPATRAEPPRGAAAKVGADDGKTDEQPDQDAAPSQPTAAEEQKSLMAGYRDAYKKYNEGTPRSVDEARREFEALIRREPAFHLARQATAARPKARLAPELGGPAVAAALTAGR